MKNELNTNKINTKNYNFLNPRALILITLLFLTLIIISANTASAAGEIYVNGTSGSDSNNGTSWQYAKLSIKNATGTATSGDTVHIADGTYTGTGNKGITIDKNMTLIGQSQIGTIINAQGSGRIFIINNGVKVTIHKLTLTQGQASSGGAIQSRGTLTVTGSTFTGNNVTGSGGAIDSNGDLTVSDSTFKDNTADYGGAIYNNRGNVTVVDSTFTDNRAIYSGGTIYSNGDLTVVDSTFTGNNVMYGSGGAICNNGDLTVNSSNFINNTADYGGAIDNEGTLTVSGSTFTNNTATQYGGAIHNTGSSASLNVTNTTFTDNRAIYSGGAISTRDGMANVHFSRIVGNFADMDSAIYRISGTVNATNNWWGSNSNPSSHVSDGVIVGPWLVLTVTADPDSVLVGGNSTVTVDLLHDSDRVYHDPANGHVPDGIHVTFTVVGGIISPESSTLINGVATSTFTASAAGTGSVTALVDGQSVPVSIVSLIPTNTTVDSVTGYPGQNVDLVANVKDYDGNPVTEGRVLFMVNGEAVDEVDIDEYGRASLNWRIPVNWVQDSMRYLLSTGELIIILFLMELVL